MPNLTLAFFFQTQLQKEKNQNQMELHAKLEKLEVLEKECFKLTTTQKTAEVSKPEVTICSYSSLRKTFCKGYQLH